MHLQIFVIRDIKNGMVTKYCTNIAKKVVTPREREREETGSSCNIKKKLILTTPRDLSLFIFKSIIIIIYLFKSRQGMTF